MEIAHGAPTLFFLSASTLDEIKLNVSRKLLTKNLQKIKQ